MCEDPRNETIVRSVVDLARNLHLRVVAEGVEDERTLTALADLRCDFAQGYHISRPVPASELMAWLAGRARSSDRLPSHTDQYQAYAG
jgi:EAL domain-containing protein (putative c-di-GMP-specific phosphodiesterase class I)